MLLGVLVRWWLCSNLCTYGKPPFPIPSHSLGRVFLSEQNEFSKCVILYAQFDIFSIYFERPFFFSIKFTSIIYKDNDRDFSFLVSSSNGIIGCTKTAFHFRDISKLFDPEVIVVSLTMRPQPFTNFDRQWRSMGNEEPLFWV